MSDAFEFGFRTNVSRIWDLFNKQAKIVPKILAKEMERRMMTAVNHYLVRRERKRQFDLNSPPDYSTCFGPTTLLANNEPTQYLLQRV